MKSINVSYHQKLQNNRKMGCKRFLKSIEERGQQFQNKERERVSVGMTQNVF